MIAKFKKIFFENSTLKATIFKNFMWLATSNVASRAIKAGLTIYAARVLGAAGYGVVSYALGLAGFFTFIKNVGVDVILTREVAKKPQEQHFYFSTTVVIEAGLLLITAILLLFVAPVFGKIPEAVVLLPFITIMIVADDIRDLFVAFFRGKEQMELEALVVVVGNIAVAVFGFFALFISPTPLSLVIAYVCASLAGVLAAIFFVRGLLLQLRKNFQKSLVVPILRSSLPIVLSGMAGVFMYNVDVIMLGWWRTAEEIGWYSAAQRLVGITSVLSTLVATATFPALARLVHEGALERLQNLLRNILKMNFLIVVPVVVGGVVLSVPLVNFFFGSTYANAALPLSIYIFSLLANYQSALLITIIYAFDKQVSTIWYSAITSTVNVLLSFWLIRSYGIVGAAITGVIVSFLFVGMLWRKAASLTVFRVPSSVVRFAVAAGGMGFVAFTLLQTGMHVLLVIGCSIVLYFVFLELLGERLRKEIRSFFRPT